MPFSFTETEVDDISTASKWDVPMNTWLGIKFGQGFHDTFGNVIERFTEEQIWDNGDLMTPEVANRSFGIPGRLDFKEPISIQKARLFRERKDAEIERQMYEESASHSWHSLKAAGGFVASVAGSIAHPLDLGLGYLIAPVGSSAKAASLAETGASAWRIAATRGLITRESLQAFRFPRFTEAVIDGTFGNAVFEIPVYLQNVKEQADYTEVDSVVNIVAGGIFSGGLHLGLRGLERITRGLQGAESVVRDLDRDTQAAMFRQAANQILNDELVDVGPIVKLDKGFIAKQVVTELRQSLPTRLGENDISAMLDRASSLSDTIEILQRTSETSPEERIQLLAQKVDAIRELKQVTEQLGEQDKRIYAESLERELPLREEVAKLRESAKAQDGQQRIETLAKAVDAERIANEIKAAREQSYFESPRIQRMIDEKQQQSFKDFLTENRRAIDEKAKVEGNPIKAMDAAKAKADALAPRLSEEQIKTHSRNATPEDADITAVMADAKAIEKDLVDSQLTPEEQQALKDEIASLYDEIDETDKAVVEAIPCATKMGAVA